MDSCYELHGPGTTGEPTKAGWASAPLASGVVAPGDSSAAADALAAHLMLMDMEEGDLGMLAAGDPSARSPPGACGSPNSLPRQPSSIDSRGKSPEAGMPQMRSRPVVPTGFTPAESYVDRQDRTVFFAKCSPSASVEAVTRLFGAFGDVEEVNLFRQWPNAKANRGCGLVVMTTQEGATAAIEALHRRHTWEGLSAPMVVERCCAARLGVKAATQHTTRVRRTALAAAARRAARVNASWHGATAAAAALLDGGAALLSGYPGAMVQMGPGGVTTPLPRLGSLGSSGVPQGLPLAHVAAAAAGPRSAPLPVVRAMAAATAASSSPPGLYYSSSPPAGSGPLPPVSAALPQAYAASLPQAAPHYALQPPAAPMLPATDLPLCSLGLASPAQVAAVCEHAPTLSALSGASFYLTHGDGGVALSGTPAQVSTAMDLVAQLLVGGTVAAGASAAAAAAGPMMCWQ